jgi:hypothetical protein
VPPREHIYCEQMEKCSWSITSLHAGILSIKPRKNSMIHGMTLNMTDLLWFKSSGDYGYAPHRS